MVLPFNIEMQIKSRWCWAATSKSVSTFYRAASIWSQCSVASAELSLACCNTPFPAACDRDWYLDRALTRTGNFVSIANPVSWETVEQEINQGRVLGARIGWFGRGGHFMVIHGTSVIAEQQFLHIDDPISGKSMLPYDQFLNNYEGNGRWTHTYFTQTDNAGGGGDTMWLKNIKFNPALLMPIQEFEKASAVPGDDKLKLFSLDTSGGEASTTGIPHYSYVLRLDDIMNQKGFPEQAGSLRLFKLANARPMAMYEVSVDENKPELYRTSNNQKYFAQLENSLEILQNNTAGGSEPGELRLLKLPALNMEAFWLHFTDNQDADVISPVKKFDADTRFDWNKPYNRDQFWAMIRDYAAGIDTSDELLGG